jgi:hypothetical protein
VVPSAFDDFLKQAGKKLGINARFAYSASGALIDDVDVLREDEEVYISEKSGFYRSGAPFHEIQFYFFYLLTFKLLHDLFGCGQAASVFDP